MSLKLARRKKLNRLIGVGPHAPKYRNQLVHGSLLPSVRDDERSITSACLDVPVNEDHAPGFIGSEPMPKGEQRGNREAKKPKKEKAKTIAAAPSTKGVASAAIKSETDRKR